MIKPYIFGHRGYIGHSGAMGYCIENTLSSFRMAVKLGVGIETDVRLTKDKVLVCFHDPSFKFDSKWISIKNLTVKQLQDIKFEDNRQVPTIAEVFETFNDNNGTLRYSCDIGSKRAGVELIKIARKYSLLNKIEITDMSLRVLSYLRKFDKDVNLVHTVPLNVKLVNNKSINLEKVKELNINVLNLKYGRKIKENFINVMDNGLKAYVWGVNTKTNMLKVLKMEYKGEKAEAVYTDFPDILKKLRDELFN